MRCCITATPLPPFSFPFSISPSSFPDVDDADVIVTIGVAFLVIHEVTLGLAGSVEGIVMAEDDDGATTADTTDVADADARDEDGRLFATMNPT